MSIKSRLEDILFSVIQHLPIVPGFLMNWTNDYLNRRITQLQYYCRQWDKASLENTIQKFTNGNRTKKSTNRKLSFLSVLVIIYHYNDIYMIKYKYFCHQFYKSIGPCR